MKRIPFKSGDEQDVLNRNARKHYVWTQRPGATSAVKRRYRRRERRLATAAIAASRDY
jgi:hypothetical protein